VCGAVHTCPPEGHTCPVPHTCPPEGHRDDVAGGARGCWVGTMWRAAPAQCQGVQVSRSSRLFGGKRDPSDGGEQESRAVRQSTTTCARGHRRSRLMLDIAPQR